MDPYLTVRTMLAWTTTVAVLGFLTFPWLILAYKLWHGFKPIDEELSEELLARSWYAGWGTGAGAVGLLLVDYVVAEPIGLPAGPIHFVAFICLLSLAAWQMMYCFAMEDFFQGLILAIMYLYLPAPILLGLSYLFKNPIQEYVLTWLVKPA